VSRALWAPVPDLAKLAQDLPQTQQFCSPSRYEAEVWARLQDPGRADAGAARLPFRRNLIAFRSGETTLWAGANSSGKSTMVSLCEVSWAMAGFDVVSLSLEEDPIAKVERYVRQVLGAKSERLTHRQYLGALEAIEPHLTLLDITGRMEPLHALALMQYAWREHGAQHFVLDNLTMCVPLGQEADSVLQQFVGNVHALARASKMHIHCIAHIRKPLDNKPPGRYDIRGTGSASDQVDNVLMFWRDEAGEDKGARTGAPENMLRIDKQRRNGERHAIPLWHHQASKQFLVGPSDDPIAFFVPDQFLER